MLNGASRAPTPQNNPMAMMSQIRQVADMLRTQDTALVAQMMAQRVPQFAEFMQMNQGKSVEQVAAENGVDINLLRQLRR